MMKRTFDVFVSGCALLLLLPALLMVAAAVRVNLGAPVLFRQMRPGLGGAPFLMVKFRTMRDAVDGSGVPLPDEVRLTGLGRFLRSTSIDELPELWNVLKGDMSLVGPRPPLPSEVARFEPWQRRKLSVKPGLTCIWQVSGRNKIDFEDWMKLDLQYIDNWSLWLDAKILLRTIPAVLTAAGAK